MEIFILNDGKKVEVNSPQQARNLLAFITDGSRSFELTAKGAQQHRKLLDLSVVDMGEKFHAGDAKRAERSWAQNMRKRRSGSRKG